MDSLQSHVLQSWLVGRIWTIPDGRVLLTLQVLTVYVMVQPLRPGVGKVFVIQYMGLFEGENNLQMGNGEGTNSLLWPRELFELCLVVNDGITSTREVTTAPQSDWVLPNIIVIVKCEAYPKITSAPLQPVGQDNVELRSSGEFRYSNTLAA